jgi:Co/Zn/Cd efflux system component
MRPSTKLLSDLTEGSIRISPHASGLSGALRLLLGLVALTAKVVCLVLITRHRQGEVHMRASWIFSKNDVIANLGVTVAGW